jgi:hypothetical protein
VNPTPIQVASLGRTAANFLVNKTNGVKYIKLNNIDARGNDQSDYLTQLQTITLTYPDRSDVTYNIAGVQSFGTYILYSIGPYAPGSVTNFNTSSVGDINNYIVSFQTSSVGVLPSLLSDPINFTNYTVLSGNTLGYFTASSGIYLPGQTPNTQLTLGGNFSYTYTSSPGGSTVRFYIHNGTIDRDTIYFTEPVTTTASPVGTLFSSMGVDINPVFIEGLPVYISLWAEDSGVTLTSTLTFNLGQTPSEFNTCVGAQEVAWA